ncbi:receptor expression-enhancing protein 6 isoform X2 [Tamandua tetradactyla]|uniref:receptor expression-enhancing protein 6 isoform X2 n=1 Tax=Tamandua tetradactyla TaxID=48850 RepID=UPI0040544357
MRRERGGRPHLLCPPCPPIGRRGGPGAETGAEAERGGELGAEGRRRWRGRCVGPRSSADSQPRARRCHGRSAPAARAASGAEEFGHRGARHDRSQDWCREVLFGRGCRSTSKPVSSVRLRGVSAVQSRRLCVPRLCFNQSHREPKQGGRHCMAHLLGSIRPVRAGRVLQRPAPVLVPFLLRGQAPRGRGPRRERAQRASPGRGGRTGQGRQNKHDPSAEGAVKQSSSPSKDLQAAEQGTLEPQASSESESESQTDSPAQSPAQSPTQPSRAAPGLPPYSQTQLPTGSASGPQLTSKARKQSGLPSTHPGGFQAPAGRRRTRISTASSAPPMSPNKSLSPGQPSSGSPSPTPPLVQTPGSNTLPVHPPSKATKNPRETPGETPGETTTDVAPKSSHNPSRQSSPRPATSPCHSSSSLDYTSESTAELTYRWPHRDHGPRCLRHCWQLKHLAC